MPFWRSENKNKKKSKGAIRQNPPSPVPEYASKKKGSFFDMNDNTKTQEEEKSQVSREQFFEGLESEFIKVTETMIKDSRPLLEIEQYASEFNSYIGRELEEHITDANQRTEILLGFQDWQQEIIAAKIEEYYSLKGTLDMFHSDLHMLMQQEGMTQEGLSQVTAQQQQQVISNMTMQR